MDPTDLTEAVELVTGRTACVLALPLTGLMVKIEDNEGCTVVVA